MSKKIQARIARIKVGRMTYFRPEIKKKFLFWNFWVTVWASTVMGRYHFCNDKNYIDRNECAKCVQEFADLTETEIEWVDYA